jgi:hypothetical protein
MAQLEKAQKNQLKALMAQFKRLQKQLQAVHKKTGYEDLGHGVLALEIAEHTVEEALEHTGLSGHIRHKSNSKAHRQALQWRKSVQSVKQQASKFFKTHSDEDLETALKALAIAEASLEEVAERYE